jgi:hypothetical protein
MRIDAAADRLTISALLSACRRLRGCRVVPRSEAGRARGAASSGGPWDHPRLHRQQTLALHLFAGELAGAADGFRFLPDSLLGGFFVTAAEPHLAEYALALHLFLQHPEGLVDIVVTDENLHGRSSSIERLMARWQGARATGARICTIRVPMAPAVRTNVDIRNCACRWAPRLPIGTETSVRRRFLGSSSDKSVLASINGRAGDKEQ